MIGVDLVYLPEFMAQKKLGGDTFLKRAFNKDEINGNLKHLAGVWATKEAVVKAIGRPNTEFKSIKIIYDKNGQPRATYDKRLFEVSISHHGDYAVAVAIEAKR